MWGQSSKLLNATRQTVASAAVVPRNTMSATTKAFVGETSLQRPATHGCIRSFVRGTVPIAEKITMTVPTMGDSITEGTIVEWTASIGQAVKEGDVVALVETDKVTIDIKAEVEGVVVEHYGAVDDTVEVGADLYQIDTEAEATVTADIATTGEAPPIEVAEPTPAAAPAPAAPAAASAEYGRTPSIHFLGKEGWALRLSGMDVAQAGAPAATASAAQSPTASIVLDGSHLDAMYGRPKFTEEEMEALILGGASVAPEVQSHSGGATFG